MVDLMSNEDRKAEEETRKLIEKRLMYSVDASNIVGEETYKKLILKVAESINRVISDTIGPYGLSNLIHDPYSGKGAHFSKDGRDNMHNLIYSSGNPIPTSLMAIFRDISNYIQWKIGDGTSSGIPIAVTLYKELYKKFILNKELKVSPAGFSVILIEILNNFEKNLFKNEKYYKKIDIMDPEKIDEVKETLTKVGMIAGNNDKQAGEMIRKLYDKEYKSIYPAVNIVEGFSEEDEIMEETGFELNSGMLEQAFKNNQARFTYEAENVRFLMFDGPLVDENDVAHLNKMVYAFNTGKLLGSGKIINDEDGNPIKPSAVCIMATEFSPEVTKWAINNVQGLLRSDWDNERQQNVPYKANMVLIPGGHNNVFGVMPFNDLRISVGAQLFNSNNSQLAFEECIDDPDRFYKTIYKELSGSAKKIQCSTNKTLIFGGGGDQKEILEQIKNIELEIQEIMAEGKDYVDEKLHMHRTRCDLLKADLSRIKVGGRNIRERKAKMSFYDDIIRSIRSAIRDGGVTLGGNLSISHYIKHNRELIIGQIKESVVENKKNVVLGKKSEQLTAIIDGMLDCVSTAFQAGYKAALMNAVNDEDVASGIIDDCLKSEKFQVYNLITDNMDSLEDFDNCNLVVPASIDVNLMKIIFTNIRQLISSKNYLTGYSADVEDFKELLNEEAARKNIIMKEDDMG